MNNEWNLTFGSGSEGQNLGAVNVELTSNDVREIDEAASEQGARYSERLEGDDCGEERGQSSLLTSAIAKKRTTLFPERSK